MTILYVRALKSDHLIYAAQSRKGNWRAKYL